MNGLPVYKRKFFAFLSHAHADNKIVDNLNYWLSETVGIPIWYDARNLLASAQIATELPKAIAQCRAMIIILSESSVASGWVKEEYETAVSQRTQFKDFRIIPVRIEKCDIPGFLETTKWIDLVNGDLHLETANELLASLYYTNMEIEPEIRKDIYISRTWRESEAQLADHICHQLDKAGFRLIGDSKDQPGFEKGNRVRSIISSCGGLVAILPHRGEGNTSKYMLEEIEIARDLHLPTLIIADPSIQLPDDLAGSVIHIQGNEINNVSDVLHAGIEDLKEIWKKPAHPHYIFFATDLNTENDQRNQVIRQIIQRVTAVPGIFGENIRESGVQKAITEKISSALMMIADISGDNINTLIEAGIARGANKQFYLVASGPRCRPPFMFRDQQVWHYADDIQLLGIIHKIVYPYRRRVLNNELPKSHM